MNKYSTTELKKYSVPTLKKLCIKYDISTKTIGSDYTNVRNRTSKRAHRLNITTNGNRNKYELAFDTKEQKNQVLQKFYNKNLPYNIYIE